MKPWIKNTWRWLAFACAAGAWWAGSLWYLLESTRGLPGILSGAPGLGAFELMPGQSRLAVLAALFLLGALPPLAIGLLRNVLDPDGSATQGLFWPLRSSSFVAASLIWIALGAALIASSNKYLWLAYFLASLLVWYLTPFAAWNTEVLNATRPARWWRPRWPGWKTMTVYLAVLAAGWFADGAEDKITDSSPLWVDLLFMLTDLLRDACVAAILIVVWLHRAKWKSVRRDLGRIWVGMAGELAYAFLCLATVALVLLIPVLLVGVWMIYFVPSFKASLGASNQLLPPTLQWLVWLAEYVAKYWFLAFCCALAPAGFYLALALGRIVRSRQWHAEKIAATSIADSHSTP